MSIKIQFTKMHGLGNDFMVIDGINQSFTPDPELIKRWGSRHTGIGFDQLLLVETTDKTDCDFKYRIFNCDGSEVEQCGNGARCFVKYINQKGLTDKKEIKVETKKKIITLAIQDDGMVKVNMGRPNFDLEAIPFIPSYQEMYQDRLVQIISVGEVSLPITCVNVGNPHAVVVIDDVAAAPVSIWGKAIEYSEQFPEKTNVEFMQVISREHVNIRVHERGVGETLACGSGACAAAVVGISLGILDNQVTVTLPGGDLKILWSEGKDIIMVGPAEFVFDGVIESV